MKNLFFLTSTRILIATTLLVPATIVLAQGAAPSPATPAKTKAKVKAKPTKKTPIPSDSVDGLEAPSETEVKPVVAPEASGALYSYPYHDSFIVGDNTLRYALYAAQEVKPAVLFALGFGKLNSKGDDTKTDHTMMLASTEVLVPVQKKIVFSINPTLQTDDWKSSSNFSVTGSQSTATSIITSTSKAKTQDIGTAVNATILASSMIDVGAGIKFYSETEKRNNTTTTESTGKSTNSTATSKFSTSQMNLAVGAHSSKWEGSLQFQPGVKYSESTTTSSDTSERTSDVDHNLGQDLQLFGRYQILPSGFFGSGYVATKSSPDSKSNQFGLGAGTSTPSVQMDGSVIIGSVKSSESETSSEGTASQTYFKFNIATLADRAPRFGLGFDYYTANYKLSSTTIALSYIGITAVTAIRF